ncbi:hypothetical protein [uncultured Dokdonia sp.]|uniref:hypothetical protein n=1 Tax=uncultured Dokdonia sp. TaxID=575653 RepID=UPI0030EB639A|tara:strand:+ start:86904 stop:87269 length:366 start_codon:yes stop_codon:yes gene_type:complete
MIVYGVCKSCHNHLSLNVLAGTRPELSKQIGASISKKCSRCGVTTTFTINQLKAKLSKRIRHAVLEVAIVGVVVLLASYYFLTNTTYIASITALYSLLAIGYVWYTRRNFQVIDTFNRSKA